MTQKHSDKSHRVPVLEGMSLSQQAGWFKATLLVYSRQQQIENTMQLQSKSQWENKSSIVLWCLMTQLRNELLAGGWGAGGGGGLWTNSWVCKIVKTSESIILCSNRFRKRGSNRFLICKSFVTEKTFSKYVYNRKWHIRRCNMNQYLASILPTLVNINSSKSNKLRICTFLN